MTVYNLTTLKNIYMRQQVDKTHKRNYLSLEQKDAIYNAYPVDLFMPNVFVRIGLAVLTFFISLCSVGLIALFTNITHAFDAFLILMGALCYLFLEWMTGYKKHFNSGVDNLLIAAS